MHRIVVRFSAFTTRKYWYSFLLEAESTGRNIIIILFFVKLKIFCRCSLFPSWSG